MDDPFYSEEAEVMNKKVKVSIPPPHCPRSTDQGSAIPTLKSLSKDLPEISEYCFLNQLISHSYRNLKK